MSDLKAQFEQAGKDVKMLSKAPSNDDMLFLYGHYKQASEGDAKGSRPGMFDMVGRAKYDAWAEVKGQSADDAMQAYVDLIESLK